MRLLRIWILVVTTSLLCGGAVAGARAEQSILTNRDAVSAPPPVILYSQAPSPSGGLLQSSLRDPDGSASDQWAWDGFTLGSTRDITEVQWRGGYDPVRLGSGGPVADFTVSIYASIPSGIQPDISQPPLVHYEVGGNANEAPAEVLGGVQTYDYRYALPAPFQAAGGTKYWVQIEAYQPGAPDWGLAAATGGDGQYFRRLQGDGFNYQLAPGDAAFALVGPDDGLTEVCYTLSTSASPGGSGTVATNVEPNCTGDASKYVTGTQVQLTANPAPGFSFDHWSGGASGSANPTTVTLDQDRSVTAHFSQMCYTLTASVSPSGSGTVEADVEPNCTGDASKYAAGSQVQLTAIPANGYLFGHWSGDVAGSANPITVSMDGNRAATSHFQQGYWAHLPLIVTKP